MNLKQILLLHCLLQLNSILSLHRPHHHHHQQPQQQPIQGPIQVKWRIVESSSETPPIYNSCGISINDQIYTLTGSNQSSKYTNDVGHYDPVEDRWEQVGSPNDLELLSVVQASATVCGNRIYLFGGKEDFSTSSAQLSVYDTQSKIWNGRNNYHPSPPPMHGHSFTAVSHSFSRELKKSRRLSNLKTEDPELTPIVSKGVREEMQKYSGAWEGGGGGALGNAFIELENENKNEMQINDSPKGNCDIFLIGGKIDGWIGLLSDSIWIYDTVVRGWKTIPKGSRKAPAPRIQHVAVSVKAEIFIYGGDVGMMSSAISDDCWIFDTVSIEWNPCPAAGPKPSPLVGSTGVEINNIIYIFGGYDGHDVSNSVHAFDMKQYKWVSVDSATPSKFKLHPRAFHIAVSIPTDNIILNAATKNNNNNNNNNENDENEEFQEQWQQIIADDGVKNVMVVIGGSGFYENSPIFADTWVMEPIIKRGEVKAY